MNDPIEFLGYLAATCDLEAARRNTPNKERRDLERRAAKYRDLQLAELQNYQPQNR